MSMNFNGIDKISVRGYKSIEDETIELRPVTILAGANSSGKSSIMQPLLLLKQTLEEKSGTLPLYLPGDNVKLTQYEQIRPKFETATKNEFAFGVENYFLRATSVFRYNETTKRIGIYKTIFDYSPYAKSSGDKRFDGVEIDLFEGMSADEVQEKALKFRLLYGRIDQEKKYELKRESCFLAIRPINQQDERVGIPGGPDDTFRPAGVLYRDIRGIIHLPGLRCDPSERKFPRRDIEPLPADDAPTYLCKGRFPDYTATLIEAWQEENNSRIAQLIEYVQKLRLATTVSTRQVDDSFLEILVGWHPTDKQPKDDDFVNIADVGCGVSQVLPVLVALVAAKKSQIVYIEQPEIHLHPKASIALANVIASAVTDAAKRGVKVVVETHSDLLLLALQTSVSEHMNKDGLNPEDVILYWFEKITDPKDGTVGATKITKGTLDENGNYDDWPEDFIATTLEQQRKFLDAMIARNKRKEGSQ